MPIQITLQIKLALEESALEDALEEYDELTVSEMVKQVLDKAIALEDVDVTVGSLDHPENHPADRTIWTSVAVPWLRLDEHLPSHPGFTSDDAQS